MVVGPIACPELIGRADELRELIARRLSASKSHGALVLVTGEAGIGKSRLIQAFGDELAGRRTSFGIGYCRPTGNAPYAPFAEGARAAGFSLEISSALSRGEQLSALAGSIATAAQRRNIVLVLEDLHWADAATLGLVSHLIPTLASLPFLLVVTYRTDVPIDLQTSRSFARIERHAASKIALAPLTPAEMRRLLRLATAERYHAGAEQLDDIVERAEGNPFFAEELLKSLTARAANPRIRSLPLTIRAAVEERLAELDEATLRIVQYASIFGRAIEPALLAQLCEPTAVDVLTALRRMRDLQLIEESPRPSGCFAFKHALIRDVIYESMLVQQAQPLHRRLLQLLEARPGSSVYDLAYQSSAADDTDRCIFYNERAGDEAAALHAYLDASSCYERATREARTPAVRLRLLAKAADVCARDGKSVRARELYAQASESASACGERTRAIELLQLCAVQARLSGDNERAVSILSSTLASIGDDEPRLRAELSLNLAFCKLDLAEVTTATALIDATGETAAASFYWRAATYAAAVKADVERVRECSAREISSSLAFGNVATLRGRFNLGFNFCVLGFDHEALTVFDAILPELRGLHLSSLEVLSCANAALVHVRRANFAAAHEMIVRGAAVPEPATTGPIALAAAALTLANLGGDRIAAGMVSEDVVDAAFGSGIDSTLGRFAGPYGRWLAAQHRNDDARAVLARAVHLLHGPFGTTETLLAAVELGDGATMQRAMTLADGIRTMHHLPLYAATAAHLRALAALRHKHDDVVAHAAEAVQLYESLGWPLHAARCKELSTKREAESTYRKLHAKGELRRTLALSPREMEIARMAADGLANKLIAASFRLSLRTVEKHLTSIYLKLGLRNRAELVALMTQNRLKVGTS
jgi:DNA-binding CsgD family transcriptional regulator